MSQTDIEKMLSKTETIYAADAAMSLVIKDQSIHDLFMLLAERKGVSEIIIAEDKTTSEKLVLSKRDKVLGFYLISNDARKTPNKHSFLRKRAAKIFHNGASSTGYVVARRTAGMSQISDIKKIVDSLHLTPELLEHRIREAIEKTISPREWEAEERIDGLDRYTPSEKELWQDQYNFDMAILTLIEACKDLPTYQQLHKDSTNFQISAVVVDPVSQN